MRHVSTCKKKWTCVPWNEGALISEWEKWGNPSTHENLSWQFIWAILHTNQANTNSVYFPNGAEKESGFLLKRFLCQPNAIERHASKGFAAPTASPVNNRRTQTQKSTKTNHSQKKGTNAWKKSRPCAPVLKNQYLHLGTQAAEMPVFHVQRFGTKSEKGPIQNIISGRTFCVWRVWWFFSQLRQKNSNVNCFLNGRWWS